ncbi:MAG: hypothetical protein KA233_11580 [Novosphingobium sp.]|nr:hypothetical protein [Novosphingobium sp.]MBP6556307.1 hypothetical protein [Novosphingobium sp.]
MRRNILFALSSLLALVGTSAALAEGDPTQQIYAPGPIEAKLTTGEITPIQRAELYQPRGPRPGLYRMRVLHSGNCIGTFPGPWPNTQERPVQDHCINQVYPTLEANDQLFAFVPHPAGGHTIRVVRNVAQNGRISVPGQISNCLTVAPGVVIGPARIEARACEVPNGEAWTGAGSDDQRFLVQQMAANAWELRFAGGNVDSPDCIAARGASRESGSDFIKWGCNGNADQRFMLEWVKPFPADLEAATLARTKWFPFADGPYWQSPANGVDLIGPSYATFETIDDKGAYCMKRCAELGECKAWTWSAAGYLGQPKPMCSWKSNSGRPVNRGRGFYGKVYSGIVR